MQWLKAAGYAEPPVNKVDPRLVYAKRAVRMPSDWAEVREGGIRGALVLQWGNGNKGSQPAAGV